MRIREFQDLMRRLYFLRDSGRGVKGTYDRLVDEVEELGQALEEKEKEALQGELADVIAWLASLANITDVDLESVALEKYDGRCPKCKHSPCQCTF